MQGLAQNTKEKGICPEEFTIEGHDPMHTYSEGSLIVAYSVRLTQESEASIAASISAGGDNREGRNRRGAWLGRCTDTYSEIMVAGNEMGAKLQAML